VDVAAVVGVLEKVMPKVVVVACLGGILSPASVVPACAAAALEAVRARPEILMRHVGLWAAEVYLAFLVA
jgi:hypothetical protein